MCQLVTIIVTLASMQLDHGFSSIVLNVCKFNHIRVVTTFATTIVTIFMTDVCPNIQTCLA
jgi:hypothetical protein